MNKTQFKNIRAKQLLKNCENKAAEYTKYIEVLNAEDWSELDVYDYYDRCQLVAFYKGRVDALADVISEIKGWC